jgi:hypothetical protein
MVAFDLGGNFLAAVEVRRSAGHRTASSANAWVNTTRQIRYRHSLARCLRHDRTSPIPTVGYLSEGGRRRR